eukprot:4196305-Amphidinium_carterae.1
MPARRKWPASMFARRAKPKRRKWPAGVLKPHCVGRGVSLGQPICQGRNASCRWHASARESLGPSLSRKDEDVASHDLPTFSHLHIYIYMA